MDKAKAYLPANDAHGMLRLKLLEMEEKGWLDRFGLVNVIHDALLFHCPVPLVDECASEVKGLMEAPVAQLADAQVAPEGFWCGVEVSVGEDWAKGNMKEQ